MNKTAAPAAADLLHQKLADRTAHVGVVGLGYVGLPLAVELARAGFRTTGIDLDTRKVDAINRGESYIQDVPTAEVAAFQQSGKLSATADPSVVSTLDTVNICVPTPLRKTKDPDLSYVVSAVEMIAAHLRPGGVFTYLSGEMDSVGRAHQRLLFEHFSSIRVRRVALDLPADVRDTWWADTMAVIEAER